MQRTDFNFELPENLIAQYPCEPRSHSRLLHLDPPDVCRDYHFFDLPNLLQKNDLLVFNDTKVIPARLFGYKTTGGKIEILVERILDTRHILAQLRHSKSVKLGSYLTLSSQIQVLVVERRDNFFILQFIADQSVLEILQQIGHIPLPPYIQRSDTLQDNDRYQTVYARIPGAVAAPTAGLHFDTALLQQLQELGIAMGFVTLHVGAGTFSPIRVNELSEHQMHQEQVEVSAQVCEQIAATRQCGGRVIAVGTTSVRALETAAHTGKLLPYQGDTRLFITPGYQFHVVDALVTNFHLPESTLLMLVCAFAGQTEVLAAYRHAVLQQYRFFSYGDAMLLHKKT
ncbi:MAG: tRNA preQ1(34) S-adenosylmethionine ribosyltransferase-isomerase QueA [Thiotrichaceae bacterium]